MSNGITSYGNSLVASKRQIYVDNNQNIEITQVEVSESWVRSEIDRRLLALLSGIGGSKMFADFGTGLLSKMQEQLSRDIGAMAANGRLGLNEEQVELLQAAIEGRAQEALEALKKPAGDASVGMPELEPVPQSVIDDLPLRGSR